MPRGTRGTRGTRGKSRGGNNRTADSPEQNVAQVDVATPEIVQLGLSNGPLPSGMRRTSTRQLEKKLAVQGSQLLATVNQSSSTSESANESSVAPSSTSETLPSGTAITTTTEPSGPALSTGNSDGGGSRPQRKAAKNHLLNQVYISKIMDPSAEEDSKELSDDEWL
jgi:hypothetical protein